MTENHGFYVAGGHVHIGAVAAGPNATATNNNAPPAALATDALNQVDLILQLIRRHQAELTDADVAEQIALKVRAELTAAKPDADRVTRAVSRLAARVAAVGALTSAAAGLEQMVRSLFS
jgi:hypothetical protein